MNSAQLTIVRGDLRGIATALALSLAMVANMKQKLTFAFVCNSLGIPLASGFHTRSPAACYPLGRGAGHAPELSLGDRRYLATARRRHRRDLIGVVWNLHGAGQLQCRLAPWRRPDRPVSASVGFYRLWPMPGAPANEFIATLLKFKTTS